MKILLFILLIFFTINTYSSALKDFGRKQHDVNNRNRKHKNRKKISINSVPSGAEIYINGRHHKKTTNTIVKLTIGKKYKIEVKKAGYTSEEKVFTFNGYKEKLNFKLYHEGESALDYVRFSDLKLKYGTYYQKYSSRPFTGKAIKWTRNGWRRQNKIEVFIRSGLIYKIIEFRKNKKKKEYYFVGNDQNKDLRKYIEYYENGNKRKEINYKYGKRNGFSIMYSKTGNIISKKYFVNGKEVRY